MAQLTKRAAKAAEQLDAGKAYSIEEAVSLINALATGKFTESIDVSVNLGVDPRKSDQVVRGATNLPHGTGKTVRIAVFAQGENAEKAKEAGADIVGFEDLAESIRKGKGAGKRKGEEKSKEKGKGEGEDGTEVEVKDAKEGKEKASALEFDVVIATPDAMRVVGQLGPILGPKGLMPNPKTGTVTQDVAAAVTHAKAGQVRYRTDRNGIIHGSIGKVGFAAEAIKENLETLLADLKRAKPASSKGAYVRKVVLSSTMGPGILIDQASLDF